MIDELKLATKSGRSNVEGVLDSVMRYASGRARDRAGGFNSKFNIPEHDYRTILVTSGVHSIYDLCERYNVDYDNGETVRLAAVPVIDSETNTIFASDSTTDLDADTIMGDVCDACLLHSGLVGRKFVQKVAAEPDIKGLLKELMEEFCKAANVPKDGMERRMAGMFALPYAALMLAIEWKLFPKRPKRALKYLRRLYRSTRDAIPDAQRQLVRDADSLRSELKKEGRMVSVSRQARRLIAEDPKAVRSNKCLALEVPIEAGTYEILVMHKPLVKLFGEARVRALMRHLRDDGFLKITNGRPDRLVMERTIQPLGDAYYHVIDGSFLSG